MIQLQAFSPLCFEAMPLHRIYKRAFLPYGYTSSLVQTLCVLYFIHLKEPGPITSNITFWDFGIRSDRRKLIFSHYPISTLDTIRLCEWRYRWCFGLHMSIDIDYLKNRNHLFSGHNGDMVSMIHVFRIRSNCNHQYFDNGAR